MSVEIVFEAHGTTFDNETHRSSGWFNVELSPLGKKQSEELGKRYLNENFDAIFTSDLKRAVETAQIAFKDRNFNIIKDKRLRECNYGDFTQGPSSQVDKKVMIIGHRATQYGLENLILGKPLEEVIPALWSWQPGWKYILK